MKRPDVAGIEARAKTTAAKLPDDGDPYRWGDVGLVDIRGMIDQTLALCAYIGELEAVVDAASALFTPEPGPMDINLAMGLLNPKQRALGQALAALDQTSIMSEPE